MVEKESGYEAIAPSGCGNLFELFDDQPKKFDAWEIDPGYESSRRDLDRLDSISVIEAGPLRGVVRLTRHHEASTFVQDLVLDEGSPRLDVRTSIDWHEEHKLLKVAFPLSAHSPFATYEIPMGRSATVQQAYALNSPLRVWVGTSHPGPLPPSGGLLELSPPNLVVAAVKLAEPALQPSSKDGGRSGDLVIRFYETVGKASTARVKIPGLVGAEQIDLMENKLGEIPIRDEELSLPTGPYEIQSIRVRLKPTAR